MRDYTLLCVLADRAGIYQNYVSFFYACSQAESGILKRRGNQRRIQLVHLAPETFYMYYFAFHIGE